MTNDIKNLKETAEYINKNHVKTLIYLYERWQDEKEYENFNDYVEYFRKKVNSTIKGTKRPFGFLVKCKNGILKISIKIQGKDLQITYSSMSV